MYLKTKENGWLFPLNI